jgi:pimeloyl-ACP methyl ester carboxylesterase
MNWRGRPLTSHEVIVNSIAATTTRTGLTVHAELDTTAYETGVRVPTLVIHGADDPLIQVSGGHATAAAIADAELLVINGMGHELPRQLWPQVVERISSHIANAERRHHSA